MIRITVLYAPPSDAPAFLEHYTRVHVPLVRQMPALEGFSYSLGAVECAGTADAVHLVAYLDFASRSDMQMSLASAEGQAALADVANFAEAGVRILTAQLA